MPIKFHWVQFF